MAPCTSSVDYRVLKEILTTTITSIADEAYQAEDFEDVVASHESFFLGVAQLTDRLNPGPLRQAAKHVFVCNHFQANPFTAVTVQIVSAFVACRTKLKGYQGSGGSHGSAWHKSVKRVVDKMHSKRIQSNKNGGGNVSASPSPAKLDHNVSGSTSPAKLEPLQQLVDRENEEVQIPNIRTTHRI